MKFSKGFFFGTATAAHQIEGHNTNSDWWTWEKIPGHIKDGSTSEIACQSFEKWRDDIKLLKETHQNAYRFSLEWARIEPEEGKFNQEAIDHYRQIILELKRNNITPVVTIFHFTLPLWFAKRGGFTSFKSKKIFARFCQKIVDEYGYMIDYWIPINEPLIYIANAYIGGTWPPQENNFPTAIACFFNFVRCHKAAFKILKRAHPGCFVATNTSAYYFQNNSKGLANKILTFIGNEIDHNLYLRLTYKQTDLISLNHYLKMKIGPNDSFITSYKHLLQDYDSNNLEKYTDPESLFFICKSVHQIFKKPLLISEHGTYALDDKKRVNFLIETAKVINKIKNFNIPLLGYLHWSLLDNFEWKYGYTFKMGLFTRNRQAKQSAFTYRYLIDKYSQ